MNKLVQNPVVFLVGNGLLYTFYGLLIGVALVPSALLVVLVWRWTAFWGDIPRICGTALAAGVGVYVFFVAGLLVFGLVERILSLGFRPGKYAIESFFFLRWLVYSGVHTLCLSLILPFVLGSGFSKMYYRLIGCRMGKNAFVNTVGLHDAYLLELGDNVVLGGKSDLTCHIFEGHFLYLGKIKVGSDVMIGANCYIMPDVTIGDRCDIGANSQIRRGKKVDSGTVLMPVPAMPARQVARTISLSKKTKAREAAPL